MKRYKYRDIHEQIGILILKAYLNTIMMDTIIENCEKLFLTVFFSSHTKLIKKKLEFHNFFLQEVTNVLTGFN